MPRRGSESRSSTALSDASLGDPLAERLARWSSGFTLGQAPDAVVENAKRSLIDTLGVTLAGTRTVSAEAVRRAVRRQHGRGAATVIGEERKASAGGAAFANAMAAQALDFDDTCFDGIVHASAVVFPAALAVAEIADADGAELLAAFIAGSEVSYAVGRIATGTLYDKGWYTTAVLGAVGAAAAASRAHRLDAATTATAIGLALAQNGSTRALLGSAAKPYSAARAAESGILAAELAREGMTAPLDGFERSCGFFEVYNDGRLDTEAIESLGESYAFVSPGIAYKLYPVCSAAQAAVEATLTMCRDHAIKAGDVASIHCEVAPLVLHLLTCERPSTVMQAQFCLPFAVGCALVFGRLTVEQLDPEILGHPQLVAAMNKVGMSLSEEMAADPTVSETSPEGASVRIVLRDGRTFELENRSATGTPVRPFATADLERKFRDCARDILSPQKTERLLSRMSSIERLPNVRTLFG